MLDEQYRKEILNEIIDINFDASKRNGTGTLLSCSCFKFAEIQNTLYIIISLKQSIYLCMISIKIPACPDSVRNGSLSKYLLIVILIKKYLPLY